MIDRAGLASLDLRQPGDGDLHLKVLRLLIGDETEKSLIDLNCGEMTSTRHLKFRESVHVDVIDEDLRPDNVHFFLGSSLGDGEVFERKYDVAIISDGIEHFTKSDGLRLADRMTKLAKLSIIFTPLGQYLVFPESTDPHVHKSGWLPADLPDWETLVFPNWHLTLGIGALFFYRELVDDSTP